MKSMTFNPAAETGREARPLKKQGLKRLLTLNLPHRKRIVLASICVLLVNGALLDKPYILKIVIDDFLTQHMAQRGFFSLTSMGLLYFGVVALSGFFAIAQVNLINKAGQEIMRSLRSRVFKTIQLLPLRYLDKTSSGNLITRATNDVEALSELYTDVLLSLFQDVFLILGIIGAMFLMDARLALVSFSVIPSCSRLFFSCGPRSNKISDYEKPDRKKCCAQ